MSKTLAVFNQCGGVSKSTLTHNLGHHLAHRKFRVLLVDIDPQASLTIFCGADPDELEFTVTNSVLEGKTLPILKESYFGEKYCGVHLVPSDINLAAAELQLVSQLGREYKLKKALAPYRQYYDFILIDCPPSLGLLSILGVSAADSVIVPIQCQYKSLKGTELLLQTIASVRQELNPDLGIAAFVPTQLSKQCSQDTRSLTAIKDKLSSLATVTAPLPKATAFADAAEEHQPLALYDPKHSAIIKVETITQAIIESVKYAK